MPQEQLHGSLITCNGIELSNKRDRYFELASKFAFKKDIKHSI